MWSWMLEVSADTRVIVHLHLLGCRSIMYLAVMSFTTTKYTYSSSAAQTDRSIGCSTQQTGHIADMATRTCDASCALHICMLIRTLSTNSWSRLCKPTADQDTVNKQLIKTLSTNS